MQCGIFYSILEQVDKDISDLHKESITSLILLSCGPCLDFDKYSMGK